MMEEERPTWCWLPHTIQIFCIDLEAMMVLNARLMNEKKNNYPGP